ncbi:MAG: hypothetical protein V4759_08495 [Pseudomonadota bacterium]
MEDVAQLVVREGYNVRACSGFGRPASLQAETHIGPDGEVMEVLGLILPDGGSAVALLDDVDLVDDTDPTWRALVAGAVDGSEAADDQA